MTEEEEKSASETPEADAEFEEAPEEGAAAEPEETAEDVFEDETEEGAAEATGNDGFAKADESEEYEEEDYEEDYEEDGDDADEDFEEESDEESDEDYEEEDYEEEDFEDEDSYDDADEDDEEEFGRGRSSRGSGRKKGGFLGFFKKVFGSDSDEDDDGDDFDDFDDEPVKRTFDEFKDYPEDIDLLPKEHLPEADFEEEELFADDDSSYGERGRLTMQRVMKNVKYSDTDASFDEDGDVGDLSDSLFDDDDDMEYSFISSTRRK